MNKNINQLYNDDCNTPLNYNTKNKFVIKPKFLRLNKSNDSINNFNSLS